MSFIFSQTSGLDISTATSVVGIISGVGFAVWWGWYTTTKTLPLMQKIHQATINVLLSEFRQELKETRIFHSQEMQVFWAEHKEASKARRDAEQHIMESVNRLADSISLRIKHSHEEVNE